MTIQGLDAGTGLAFSQGPGPLGSRASSVCLNQEPPGGNSQFCNLLLQGPPSYQVGPEGAPVSLRFCPGTLCSIRLCCSVGQQAGPVLISEV